MTEALVLGGMATWHLLWVRFFWRASFRRLFVPKLLEWDEPTTTPSDHGGFF